MTFSEVSTLFLFVFEIALLVHSYINNQKGWITVFALMVGIDAHTIFNWLITKVLA